MLGLRLRSATYLCVSEKNMNQSALKYSATLAVVTLITEAYGAFFHDQGVGRMVTGSFQALIYFWLSYWLFVVGLKKYTGAPPQLKGLIMGGLLCWVVSYQAFRLLFSSLGPSVVSAIAPVILVVAISFLLGKNGGFAKKRGDAREIANK
jgi:drug/metabolite transporter (DMT)-like permease